MQEDSAPLRSFVQQMTRLVDTAQEESDLLEGARPLLAVLIADSRWLPEPAGGEGRLSPGDIEVVSPTIGDIHQVANAYADRASISIHLYGANIGAVARHVFDPVTGAAKPFVSGYSSASVPNLWDRSAEIRRGLAAAG